MAIIPITGMGTDRITARIMGIGRMATTDMVHEVIGTDGGIMVGVGTTEVIIGKAASVPNFLDYWVRSRK